MQTACQQALPSPWTIPGISPISGCPALLSPWDSPSCRVQSVFSRHQSLLGASAVTPAVLQKRVLGQEEAKKAQSPQICSSRGTEPAFQVRCLCFRGTDPKTDL